MIKPAACALLLFLFSLPAISGQLTVSVIQFPEIKTAAQLDEALAGLSLAELTNSNRTMTKASYLKGGYVVFSQTQSASQRFHSTTRLLNTQADVNGSLSGGRISVVITLSEGVDAGLRRFSKRVYQGASDLRSGQPRVVGIRQITEKTGQSIRGSGDLKETNLCSVVIAQLLE